MPHNHRIMKFTLWPGSIWLLASTLFMGIAAWLSWPEPEQAFLSDNSPVSWLSSAQIWAAGLLALRLSHERLITWPLGIWLMLAMVSMALDEQFMLHEWWKFGCQHWWPACKWQLVREGPMLAVGAAGIATAFWIQSTLPPGKAVHMLWPSIATGLLALTVDLLGRPVFLTAYEEGLEVLAETLFVAMLLGLTRHQQQ